MIKVKFKEADGVKMVDAVGVIHSYQVINDKGIDKVVAIVENEQGLLFSKHLTELEVCTSSRCPDLHENKSDD